MNFFDFFYLKNLEQITAKLLSPSCFCIDPECFDIRASFHMPFFCYNGAHYMKKMMNTIDDIIVDFLQKYGVFFLRISLAIIFIWFGALKPLGLSPAEELIKKTVYWFSPEIFLPILGYWEILIGVCLLWRPLIRASLFLLFLQMPGTVLPLILLPETCFTNFPFALTLEGQYIIKNLILISAAIVIGGTVHRESTRKKVL